MVMLQELCWGSVGGMVNILLRVLC